MRFEWLLFLSLVVAGSVFGLVTYLRPDIDATTRMWMSVGSAIAFVALTVVPKLL